MGGLGCRVARGQGQVLEQTHRGQIRGRVCGGPEGGVRQIHVCQRGHLRRAVEGGTETWTGDVHLEGEERKVLWGLGGWGEAGAGQVHLPQWRCLHWPLCGWQSPWAWRAGQGRWEVRSEEYKEGKLIKFTITKEKTA